MAGGAAAACDFPRVSAEVAEGVLDLPRAPEGIPRRRGGNPKPERNGIAGGGSDLAVQGRFGVETVSSAGLSGDLSFSADLVVVAGWPWPVFRDGWRAEFLEHLIHTTWTTRWRGHRNAFVFCRLACLFRAGPGARGFFATG